MNMRVLIVDDEPPARERLRQLLDELPGVECAGEAASGEEALRLTAELDPDVVLLDIRMPGMGGLEAARCLTALDEPPAVIMTTAYEQHALEAFDAQAAGYLLKPIRRDKLAMALQRAQRPSRAQLQRVGAAPARSHITARARDQLRLIPVDDVLCFVAEQKYTTVRHAGGEDLIEDSLRALEEEFAPRFVRVHRNALVAVAQIERVERDADGHQIVHLRNDGGQLKVSRRLVGELLRQLR